MTHKDIYTKFMIEYDKANVTSSYPSLTEYEVATVLDKAYNALIAQKVTGNNYRRIGLEGDLKAITDLAPLIRTATEKLTSSTDTNVMSCNLPDGTNDSEKFLYFISAQLMKSGKVVDNTPEKYLFLTDIPIDTPSSVIQSLQIDSENITVNLSDWRSTFADSEYTKEKLIKRFRFLFEHAVGSEEFDIDAVNDAIDNIEQELLDLPEGGYWASSVTILDDYSHSVAEDNTSIQLFYFHNIGKKPNPYDKIDPRPVPVKLVNHDTADKFIVTAYNMPWIKIPVCYVEDYTMNVVYDPIDKPILDFVSITYIKTPHKFVKDISSNTIKKFFPVSKKIAFEYIGSFPQPNQSAILSGWPAQVVDENVYAGLVENDVYTLDELQSIDIYDPDMLFDLNFDQFSDGEQIEIVVMDKQGSHVFSYLRFNVKKDVEYLYPSDLVTSYFWYESEKHKDRADSALSDYYTFECNDTVAEELISLAVAFALENVESQRLNSKLNMRGLEA